MSPRPLILAAIALAGIGVRFAYTATVGHNEQVTSIEGQLAHNIVKDGRWFAYNTRAEGYLAKLVAQRHRLIDPATVNYSYLDAHGQWYPEIGQSVGVSVIIAALWAITGDERYVQLQVLQGVVDGLAALLVYWIAMRLFARRRPALIAAAIYALFPPLAWQTADAYNDIWAVDFTLVIVALYLLALRSGYRWRWLVACGLSAGLGAYFRPQVLAIVPALSLAMAFSVGWREALRQAAVTTTIAVVLIVPWTIRNYHDFHAFVPMRSAFWMTMLNGLNEIPNRYVSDDSEGALKARIHRIRPELMSETPAWEALLKPIVVKTIEQHPLFYLEVLAHRVALATVLMNETTWMSRGAGDVFGSARATFSTITNRPLIVIEDALEPFVFLAAMIGLALCCRYRTRQHMLLIALVLSVLLPYITLHVEARYLLPAFPAYFIWIGLGADSLYVRARSRVGGTRYGEPRDAMHAALPGNTSLHALQA
jgi:4-amino-4-deoxy-L-arabinose transferase-like glycosyltransferase